MKTVTSEQVDRWRIVPRLFICLYGLAFFRATEWFMALPEPTNAQSAFISVIVGAGAAWFSRGSGQQCHKFHAFHDNGIPNPLVVPAEHVKI